MKTIIFNLDGTLSIAEEAISDELISSIIKLLQSHNVAIISSSVWKRFQKQIVSKLNEKDSNLSNLYLLPTSGGSLYQTWGKYGWVATYQLKMNAKDISKITKTIDDVVKEIKLENKTFNIGQLDCKESEITFSVQNSESSKVLINELQKLSAYDVICSGKVISVSLKGINKKYGIDELMKRLHISKDDVTYVGAYIHKGGEDYVAIEMGLDHVQVKCPEETKNFIAGVISNSELEKTG